MHLHYKYEISNSDAHCNSNSIQTQYIFKYTNVWTGSFGLDMVYWIFCTLTLSLCLLKGGEVEDAFKLEQSVFSMLYTNKS